MAGSTMRQQQQQHELRSVLLKKYLSSSLNYHQWNNNKTENKNNRLYNSINNLNFTKNKIKNEKEKETKNSKFNSNTVMDLKTTRNILDRIKNKEYESEIIKNEIDTFKVTSRINANKSKIKKSQTSRLSTNDSNKENELFPKIKKKPKNDFSDFGFESKNIKN
jgi:cysteinyl-tRNA synthetase